MEVKRRIEEILKDYLTLNTRTGTIMENQAQDFFMDWLGGLDYFREHPDNYGLYDLKGDSLERKIAWALIKGSGEDTLVMVQHSDIADGEELPQESGNLEEMESYLKERLEDLDQEAKEELESGNWLFGRAIADMRAGAAIQMALFEKYSQQDLEGNILLLGLVDEENLSAGMAAGLELMLELEEEHKLRYKLMLGSQPHSRKTTHRRVVYQGSVGKILPLIYVRGATSHVDQVFSGLNPLSLLAEIVRKTETDPYFIERVGQTTTPAPSWLEFRDRKAAYGVFLPPAAHAYMNVLTLDRTPRQVFDQLEKIIKEARDSYLTSLDETYKNYCKVSDQKLKDLDWQVKFMTYGQLYNQALRDSGDKFLRAHKKLLDEKGDDWAVRILENTLAHVKYQGPIIVLGLMPPYYPNVSNSFLGDFAQDINELLAQLRVFSRRELGSRLELEDYYTGISDLSYAMYLEDSQDIQFLDYNMLLWREGYYMPLDKIRRLSMAVVNLGPWGKDIYKKTERVYKRDVYEVIPSLMDWLIKEVVE